MYPSVQDNESESISLFFSIRNLTQQTIASDNHLVIELKELISGNNWTNIGHTETLPFNKILDFSTNFELNFIFETRQKFKAALLEIDPKRNYENDQVAFERAPTLGKVNGSTRTRNELKGRLIGDVTFDLSELAGSIDNSKTIKIRSSTPNTSGVLVIRMEKITQRTKTAFLFNLMISNVPKFNFFSSKNSYVKILKQQIAHQQLKKIYQEDYKLDVSGKVDWVLVEQTPNIKGDSILYPSFDIKGSKLCYDNRQVPLKFELWKKKNKGKDYLLGHVKLSIDDITSSKTKTFNFKLEKDNKSKTTLRIDNFRSEEIFTFVDFLHGGIKLNFVVGIDFTKSNKEASDRESLHFFDGRTPNLYQKAILAVGGILEKYNNNKEIAAYGFGAQIEDNTPISHFFPINLNYSNPFFKGFTELLDAYSKIVNKIKFSGPTNFETLIDKVVQYAQTTQNYDVYSYTVLLILTDGEITDLQQTIDVIVKACNLPLSIIIVGIGKEDFTKMDKLDANDEPLFASNGTTMSRDIVRFVAFEKFQNNPTLLREEVLKELPSQVVEFYKMKGIKPGKKQDYQIQDYYRMNTNSDNASLNTGHSIDNILERMENEYK